MAINNFKPFATAANANVMSQADWEALPALLSGFISGPAKSAQVNKAIRQASFIAAALAQYTANKSGLDVLDDGDLNGFISKMGTAFGKDFQALDATLTALAGLATGANKLPYFTGNDTAAQTDLTSVGRDIIGKNTIADILTYLGLGTAAKKNTGSNPGDVVTAGSDQPVYNSTLPTSEYASISHSGYMGNATVTGGDTMVRLAGLIANNVAGNWTLVNSYGSHFGTGGSIQPEDSAHILVSTDGASYSRRWYFYNNGKLVGPTGEFGNMAWVNSKVGTVDGALLVGAGVNVQKVTIPDLPLISYTGTSSRGILATATGQADSVTKAHSIQLNKPGAGGWGMNMSWGTYVGVSGSVDDVAHLLCASDGAAFTRRWYLYNNGELVGPAGKFYSEKNTTQAADGTLKAASPVIKLFADGRAETNAESEGCIVTRLAVGEYLVEGCNGLNADAVWGGPDGGFDVPTDRNKQPLIWLDYEVNADGSVLVKTYHRTHPDAPVFARNMIGIKNDDGTFDETVKSGEPIDIPADQFVSVRVEMPEDSIYHQKQEAERKAAYEAWLVSLQQAEEDAYQEDQLRDELRQAAKEAQQEKPDQREEDE
ncbi:hypothetical protein [Citrobacter freundii]|uniref:phage tail fiber protein n=1 Tax=Citrobacter freundii TaxID=546 RepID=UPI0032AE99ED